MHQPDFKLSSASAPSLWAGEAESSEPTPSANNSSKPVVSGQLPMLKVTPLDSWECPTCMVVNTSSVTSCVACTTKRPGSTHDSSHAISVATASDPVPVKPTLGMNVGGTGPGISLEQPGLGLILVKPAVGIVNKPGTGLSLGQPGLSLGQEGGLKLPALSGNVFGGVQATSVMQPPPLTLTTFTSHAQPSSIGNSSGGFQVGTGGGGTNTVVMPPLRKLHSSGPSTMPSTSGGILGAALQGTGMARGGALQVGLPSTSQGPSGLSSQGITPFSFAVPKNSGGSTLEGLTFITPTLPTTTSATSATVSVATAPSATFNFSGAVEPKPPILLGSQELGGLFKPPATSLASQGAPSLGFSLAGNSLGGGITGGLSFGSNVTSQSLGLEGPKLMFGGGIPATSGEYMNVMG